MRFYTHAFPGSTDIDSSDFIDVVSSAIQEYCNIEIQDMRKNRPR